MKRHFSRKRVILCVVVTAILAVHASQARVKSPEEFLGFRVGTSKKLADMHEIVAYFQVLDRESPRVRVQEVGRTTMDNPFIVAIITSEENQKNLEAYREYQQLLADPRKISESEAEKIISRGKAVVMINCSIHATEIGASQMAMELAYDLATRNDRITQEILDNVILLLTPMHNPDGIQMVVDWYRKTLGTPYEGGRMPWLYHKYVGHDNNRDWYMFTQKESRLTLKVHNAWHPQVIVDMHQMGSRGPRLFVPPYVDPFEPNVDPILQQEVAMMGTFIAAELTAEGKAGVAHSIGFDAWTPARAYHHYHGGIRILTEAASARLATPVTVKPEELAPWVREPSVKMPLPWKGGLWTLRDIVDYDYRAARAVLTNAVRLKETWLRNFFIIHRKAVTRKEPPYAFLVPLPQKDVSTALKMLEVLRLGGVEVYRAEASFEAEGRTFAAGTFVIPLAQPYGAFAKTLLERQRYPEIRETPGGPLKRPYDVVAHTLPLLMGVDVVEVEKPFAAKTRLLENLPRLSGDVEEADPCFGYMWESGTNDALLALNRLMKKNYTAFWFASDTKIRGEPVAAGTLLVQNQEGCLEELKALARALPLRFAPVRTRPEGPLYRLRLPRIGLYKSWTASMDEGWTRWVLEQFEFPYTSVFNKDIRQGGLEDRFDVILIPDMAANLIITGISEKMIPPEYAGGIGDIGVKNLNAFVKSGGTLITLNRAAEFAIKYFHLAVEDGVKGLSRKDFNVPGSILMALNDPSHPIAFGYARESAVFFRRSPVFIPHEGESVARYPAAPLLSGWLTGEKHLVNRSAIVDVPFEKGKVILIGFPVLYRGQSHGTFRYLFNALYYGPARLETHQEETIPAKNDAGAGIIGRQR